MKKIVVLLYDRVITKSKGYMQNLSISYHPLQTFKQEKQRFADHPKIIKTGEQLQNKYKMKKLQKQKQKKKHIQLQRLLLDPVPQTPVPAPYFSIPSPDPYRFPLGQTMLEGIKLLEHYFPEDINATINSRLGIGNVERMNRYNDVYCMMGKNGNGLVVGNGFMNVTGISAFSYGPNFLIIAFRDLRLEVYSLDLKLVKSFKKFFARPITLLKLLQVPKGYENVIFLSHDDRNVHIHRLEKSLLSKLSAKLDKKLIENLQHPVTQVCELPKMFKHYLAKDSDYRDCSLICISSVNRIDVLRINHFRLDFDNFVDIVFTKKVDDVGSNTISWGQTKIDAPSRQIKGERLVLVFSFSSKIIFLALQDSQKYLSESQQIISKYEWVESYPFSLPNKEIAFCQFIKKNEFILITDKNDVMVFNTKSFDIFEKPISSNEFEIFTETFGERLFSRVVKTIEVKSERRVVQEENAKIKAELPEVVFQMKKNRKDKAFINAVTSGNWEEMSRSEQESVTEVNENFRHSIQPEIQFKNIFAFSDSFSYEYPSTEIYYLVQSEKENFGVYVYCNWKLIADLLRIDRKYEECMLFLIAIHKKANKFDLGVKGTEAQQSKYVQQLAVEFINRVVGKFKNDRQVHDNLDRVVENEEYLKNFIKPIEFLTETEEFGFLFQVAMEKLIASLISQYIPYQKQYKKCRQIFFTALEKFIEHGRIKVIPETHMQLVLDYYVSTGQLDLIDKLAIYFDLDKIDSGCVIQCLLQNDLTVSLAHICIQGNESQFVTPFVKFWGVSANFKFQNQIQNASLYAVKALWYVKLCLQRNWALKEYSDQRYSQMISILSQHFLSQKIIVTMLQIRPQDCLQSLNLYFNNENAIVVNRYLTSTFTQSPPAPWIIPKPQRDAQQPSNLPLQHLLSLLNLYITKAKIFTSIEPLAASRLPQETKTRIMMNIFLSSIVIYRTVTFTEEKYLQILIDLIDNYRVVKDIKYGLDDKLLQEYQEQYYEFSQEEVDQVLASRYIIRILTLVYYEHAEFVNSRLITIYERARQYNLMDLQAEICCMNKQFVNAVDIYLRAKPNLRIWIFEFLESLFKKIIVEQRNSTKKEKLMEVMRDKKKLGDILTQKIKSLVELDSTKTKQIIDNYLPQIQQQLINALADNEELQLEYLQQIIGSSSQTPAPSSTFAQPTKTRLSQRSILRYVELMAKMKPDDLLQAFKNNSYFPIDECIKICEEQQVYDCLEYLYEKSGASMEAVKIAMKRIDSILRKRVYQSEMYIDDQMTHYIKIKEILDHSIEICKNTKSEEAWESLLDSSIELYNKYVDTDFPEDEIEIFFFINGQIMEHLASNCQITHTIDLLQNKYQNLNMGGKMTKAFITILANLSHSINIMFIAENMIENTYQQFLNQDYVHRISGYGGEDTCRSCKFGISKRQKSKHFHCHHSYHNECIISDKDIQQSCIYCLLNQTDQFQYHINSISSPMHPKLKKMQQIFERFNSQSELMTQILAREEKEELQTQQDSVIISFAEKKKGKLQGFDQMIKETEDGNRRVLRELRMF